MPPHVPVRAVSAKGPNAGLEEMEATPWSLVAEEGPCRISSLESIVIIFFLHLGDCLRLHGKAVKVSQHVHDWKAKERTTSIELLAANWPAS
ncbi:unnamed protein product [Caretta caretta]